MSADTFNWGDYLELSRNLLQHITSEAAFRVVASRSYYAAYWKARLLIETGGVNVPQKNVHKFVSQSYGQVWNAEGTSIGNLLRDIKALRTWADYESYPCMTKTDAERALVYAEGLIDDIENILDDEKQNVVIKANYLLLQPEYLSI
jgi:uncharacterized protein (UPF0332 family)